MWTAKEPNNCTSLLGSPKTKARQSLQIFCRSALVIKILLMYGLRMVTISLFDIYGRSIINAFINGTKNFDFTGDFCLLVFGCFSSSLPSSSVTSPLVSSGLPSCPPITPISPKWSSELLLPAIEVLFYAAVSLGVAGRLMLSMPTTHTVTFQLVFIPKLPWTWNEPPFNPRALTWNVSLLLMAMQTP